MMEDAAAEDVDSSAGLEAVTYSPAVPSTFDPDTSSSDPQSKWDHPPARSVHSMHTRSRQLQNDQQDNTMQGNEIELLPGTELISSEQETLQLYYDRYEGKEFLLHQAEGLPSFITANSYSTEELNFVKHCVPVHRSKVPVNANIISSHVLYKIKRDDGSLTCKARIAPHGNEEQDRDHLKRDSACCPPLGIRMLFSLSLLYQWYLIKIDVKGAFLQSGPAQRDVYVIPPRECQDRQFIWLFTVATYGLVNANSKWQIHSDQTILNLGLCSFVYIPQLFYLETSGKLQLVVIKATDGIFVAGDEMNKRRFLSRLGKVYELGTITHLPGSCLFFGLYVTKAPDFVIHVNAEEKLHKLSPHLLSRLRRKQSDEALNSIELFHYNSINGSIGFIGVHALPMAAFASSYLQQRRNNATVHDLAVQSSMLKKLRSYGSVSRYGIPSGGTFQLTVLVFADAARPTGNGQLGILSGLLLDDLKKGSIFHVLSWSSCLSKRPAKSIGSAEILVASTAFDEGMLISSALSILLPTKVPVTVVVDSKDLFDSLTSCHTPEDRSIRADVQLIWYYFETKQVQKVLWVPGFTNLAYPLTKKDSRLCESLQLMLFEGRIPFDFEKCVYRDSSYNLG